MPLNVSTWLGQVTTGHGFMILGPTLVGMTTGAIGWPVAVPLLVAGVVGLLWPENANLQSAAKATAADIEALVAAYRTGLDHGTAIATPLPIDSPSPNAVATVVGSAGATIIALFALSLTLSACSGQTPEQRMSATKGVASGLLCLANASGRVIATTTTSDPNAVKAVNAAVAAGSTLLTDAACQMALANGVAALPTESATPSVEPATPSAP